ncbi:MAG TPA: DUF2207 domain-containing protein [Burkholderiales bacterium]
MLLFLFSFQACAAERVLDFHSEIRIARDGRLTVTEVISVQAEGRQVRRGILRDFPTDYRDRLGNRVRVPFEVLSVARNGEPEPYALERLSNGMRIRIGSPDVLLPFGPHEYRIAYRTARQIGFFDRHDELYWNVNGNGWTFAFDRMSAEVRFADPVPADELKVEAYTGPQGSRARNYQAFVRHGAVAFRTTQALAPREGMTIVVAFPKGVVAPPSGAERFDAWLETNPAVIAALAGLLVLSVYLTLVWRRVGRDPKAGPRFPRYEPPAGLGPGAVRWLDRMGYDHRGFAAALLGLAASGYLKIREQGGRYELARTGKAPDGRELEQQILRGLFSHGQKQVFFDREPSATLRTAREGFGDALKAHFGARLFSRNWGAQAAGWILAALTVWVMFLLDGAPMLMAGAIGVMVIMLAAFYRLLPAYSVEGRKLQDTVEGLRQYLGVAEKDDLARMQAPPQTPEEFARFLPYAMALEVEKTWAERFAGILGAAAVAAAVQDYYETSSGSFEGFASSFSGMDSTVAASATAPGSASGGSGGGSSGGGGGGGGGSGW